MARHSHPPRLGGMRTPTPGRVAAAGAFALCLGLTVIVLPRGFDPDYPMRLIEGFAVLVTGAALLFGPLVWIGLRMADWRNPADENEFEQVVMRSEELATAGGGGGARGEDWGDPRDAA